MSRLKRLCVANKIPEIEPRPKTDLPVADHKATSEGEDEEDYCQDQFKFLIFIFIGKSGREKREKGYLFFVYIQEKIYVTLLGEKKEKKNHQLGLFVE